MASKRVTIGAKPGVDPRAEAWVQERAEGYESATSAKAEVYTARLTIDVTPAMRARIKMRAFEQNATVAKLLRELLEREYSGDLGPAA